MSHLVIFPFVPPARGDMSASVWLRETSETSLPMFPKKRLSVVRDPRAPGRREVSVRIRQPKAAPSIAREGSLRHQGLPFPQGCLRPAEAGPALEGASAGVTGGDGVRAIAVVTRGKLAQETPMRCCAGVGPEVPPRV